MSDGQIGGMDTAVADPAERDADALFARIAHELGELGPAGWRRLNAVFALTVTVEAARVEFTGAHRVARLEIPEPVLALVRRHRAEVAASGTEPWWRLLLRANVSGDIEVDYDYGDEPFPADQLFRPEAYRADVAVYRRPRLPVWLAAYMRHGDRQCRRPRRAVAAVLADVAYGVTARRVDAELPPFPRLWARWATISAAHVAVSSDRGPRMVVSNGWFESAGTGSSGSTLYVAPGGRAVLSGGVWDAPALNAAYNGGVDLPKLYAGAPDWVTNSVLSPRAAVGLLSFCFWWDGLRWYCGESPSVQQCGAAMPEIWQAHTVIETVARLLSADAGTQTRTAVARLLTAAERGEVTRELVADTFGRDRDIDAAMRQLAAAGTVAWRSNGVRAASRLPESTSTDSPIHQLWDGRYPCVDRIAL
ncbi:hypothetical protein OG874_40285 [Nocardia sp. NBC_00565]|uniref:hypothetical protein n=1 Tax=Nocardia sp. NBC_00565 TaxID=2975993 RepID=UPI002E818C03|nr:hypothetical protein [Nocardia sp. NBC_00565]WUC02866.1 hypothetical protein OG874_40285 [Nocardia sp. NBC_00565]